MDGNGWDYDHRGNGFLKGVLWISWAEAEQALADAEAGIDRSAPANDDRIGEVQ